jgi:hypothetical protein
MQCQQHPENQRQDQHGSHQRHGRFESIARPAGRRHRHVLKLKSSEEPKGRCGKGGEPRGSAAPHLRQQLEDEHNPDAEV